MKSEPFDRRALVEYRLNRAWETWHDAQLLAEHGGRPYSIVNRSYYAMFYALLALLAAHRLAASRHSGAIALFDREFVRKGLFPKALSRALHQAFDLRQEGDYEDFWEPTREKALEILQNARLFIEAIERHLHETFLHSS